jgi:hypothetical protein
MKRNARHDKGGAQAQEVKAKASEKIIKEEK